MEEDNKQTKINIKSLSIWVSIVCVVIMFVQIVLNLLNINFEFKLIIEIFSYVLAILVSIGILNSKLKDKSVEEIKQTIEEEINNNIEIDEEDK